MRVRSAILIPVMFMTLSMSPAKGSAPAGFFLPDSITEMTLAYRTVKGLIVLPVTINDSIVVNLVLDTGCRNLVLFGKKFTKLFAIEHARRVEFSGLGKGLPVSGHLSIGNKVSIHRVLGAEIPIIVVRNTNLFGNYHDVHGVIGYDIFVKFEIELNPREKTITFRPALRAVPPLEYARIPLQIVDARPVMQSELTMANETARPFDVMIDTGSSLGLLLKTTNIHNYRYHANEQVLGVGLNGPVSGFKTTSRKLKLDGFEINRVPTGIIASPWHDHASIGMHVLKDYVLILNYCQAYACFKRIDA